MGRPFRWMKSSANYITLRVVILRYLQYECYGGRNVAVLALTAVTTIAGAAVLQAMAGAIVLVPAT